MRSSQKVLGVRKLPPSCAAWLMPLLLSLLMTSIVAFISTWQSIGLAAGLVRTWLDAWGLSWLVAFPTLLLVLPLVRKMTAAVVQEN